MLTNTPNPVQQIGLPDSLAKQFPLPENPEQYWTLYGNPDETTFIANFNQPAGDLLIVSAVMFRYINAKGDADFVYLPVQIIQPKNRLCLHEGPSRPAFKCDNFLNENGDMYIAEDQARFTEGTLKSFLPSRKQIAEIRFGYPSKTTWKIGSQEFLDTAIMDTYTHSLLSEFAASGDSSLLPNRLLIPWFFEASQAYSNQVSTPTPFPVVDLPSDIPTGRVVMDPLSGIPSIESQMFPLPHDSVTNEVVFHCLSGKTNYEYVQITEMVLATGTLDCQYSGGVVRIPLGVYDQEQNRLVYWGLETLEDTTTTDYLAVRAEERFANLIPGYTFEYRTNLLSNLEISISLGHPSDKNMQALNTQNFAPYIDAYYADGQRLEDLLKFISTGTLPKSGFIFPFDLGIGGKQ